MGLKLHKGLMSKTRFRFRRRVGKASIDGVRAEYESAGAAVPAAFDFGRIPLSGTLDVPEDRRNAVRQPADATSGQKCPRDRESIVDRAEKKAAVTALNEVFNKTSVVVVAHYSGLTVAQMQNLRKQMRDAGATVQVAKNRLAKIALEGTDTASIASLLKGPTLLAYSQDPVAAAKVAVGFAKDNEKLVILGGAMGKTALNPEAIKSLATLPSLDELRAKLVGLIQAPATKLAQLSTAPAAKLARVISAYANKDAA